ncbi:MAG: c-type cytochrome biogenesis protein CcmI [Rhodoferax sp.]|uniref:c-type cytochrome biogenesis protein CcmI n=1 Tax=Rhodoferax sp. TaxID=50421 RepID=UPI00272216B9|nr:c-type cytochrome biogenesis protein CcmI [Rhodoferax sp.]MDO8449221.1 c-type cytochrome biogenesis protein CcmI [Rhodoferax sp.]
MTVFIAIAALLTLLVLAWVVRPLLRPAPQAGVSSQRLNAAIYRDQLKALERDLARDVISPADYEATRDELQLRLLDDTEELLPAPLKSGAVFWTARRTAAVIVWLLPLGAAGMYWWLGAPQAIEPVSAQKPEADKVATMVDGLAARLKANPDNPKGWAMLARSYKVMGRLQEAEQAFAEVGPLLESDPDLLADYADLLAARAGDSLEGKPLDLINKALALNPQHPMGLMMSGVAAYRRDDFAGAVAQWEKLRAVLEPGSPDAQQVEVDIAEARAKAGMPASAKATSLPADAATAGPMTAEKIKQMVERLAERLKANPEDLAGWARLARAYKVQGRLAESEQAYVKAGTLVEGNPDLLTQYADVLAIRAGNNLEGRPLALVNKALALNPTHPMALMMAGAAAYRRADYAQAVAHWEMVLKVLEPGSSDARQVTAEIADARSKGGLTLQLKTKP